MLGAHEYEYFIASYPGSFCRCDFLKLLGRVIFDRRYGRDCPTASKPSKPSVGRDEPIQDVCPRLAAALFSPYCSRPRPRTPRVMLSSGRRVKPHDTAVSYCSRDLDVGAEPLSGWTHEYEYFIASYIRAATAAANSRNDAWTLLFARKVNMHRNLRIVNVQTAAVRDVTVRALFPLSGFPIK